MIGICSLASGSRGNALYIGSSSTKILIDAGISFRTLHRRLSSIGVSIEQLDGVLITHEHTDHIRGLDKLSMQIPIWANVHTSQAIEYGLQRRMSWQKFKTGDKYSIGDLSIESFPISHDAADPVGFVISLHEQTIAICTDLGIATAEVREQLERCSVIYIEANHDPALVYNSTRPYPYKERVLGPHGHLSNGACAKLLTQLSQKQLRWVGLGHLSLDCNREELARETISKALKEGIELGVAKQGEIGWGVQFDREWKEMVFTTEPKRLNLEHYSSI